MTALQAAGAGICAFMVWWNATLIRSTRRHRLWPRAEARILGASRWPGRYRLRFALSNGQEVTASCGTDPEGRRLAAGDPLAIIYDPADPVCCEPAMAPMTIAGLRLLGFAAMAGGIAMLIWG